MDSPDLLRVLNRCITDKTFCNLLLTQPREALENYHLEEAEHNFLLTHTATNFYSLISKLEEGGFVTSLHNSSSFSKLRSDFQV